MKQARTMLVVLAHPDDENLMGGTLARAADEGVSVHLLTATRGEAGTIFNTALATPENIAEVRENELRCSCRILGIEPPEFLACGDGAVRGCSDSALEAVVAHIRRLRPQVMLTFGPDGMYGHPDHVAVHHLATIAWRKADDPQAFPDQIAQGLPAYMPARLFYFALVKSWVDIWREYADLTVELNGQRLPIAGVPDEDIDVIVDVEPYLEQKEAAFACHGTQLNPDSPMRAIPEEQYRRFRVAEHFVLAAGKHLPTGQQHDLFAGL